MNKKKEKEALDNANKLLRLENGFNRKDELNSIISKFREVFYRKRMDEIITDIRKKEIMMVVERKDALILGFFQMI